MSKSIAYQACLVKYIITRLGYGSELSPAYHVDAVSYLRAEEKQVAMPTLFDLEEVLANP